MDFLRRFLGASAQNSSHAVSGKKPNIIVFLVDDMGWQDTSVPFWTDEKGQPVKTFLNKRYRTPNMEALGKQGIVFTNAYAQPICSPSRCSLMSGMNSARHRVTNWTLLRDQTTDAGHQALKAPADWSEPHLWAWSAPDGTNAFSSWPGEALQEGEDGWLTLSVPGWVNSIIVNGSDGSVQTSDLSVDTGKDLWIVVSDAENAEVTYEAPAETVETAEAPAAESEPTVAAEPAETKSNTMPIAIVVVVVIAVVAGGVVISKKKK